MLISTVLPKIDAKALISALERAAREAPYLSQLMAHHRRLADQLAQGVIPRGNDWGFDATLPVPRALRQAKSRLALTVAIADLAGIFTLEGVMQELSAFADFSLNKAVHAAFDAVLPGADPIGFTVIALGKLGSCELNYSSDIDPILIFDPVMLPRRARDDPAETAQRIARKFVEIMQRRDEDGYIFRIDLRLRPAPEATPPAIALNAAIGYYESAALAWERAAFIRARVCAGDFILGEKFLNAIQPFIWRRALDFGVADEVRAISLRIRDHYAEGQVFGPGYDLKRGCGGIRECEFYAQIHQLIHGGRDPLLRIGATMPALKALAAAGHIPQATAVSLVDAYRCYRRIEHRLQMIDDQQTHSLPKDLAALDAVARLSGLKNGSELLTLLKPHVENVQTIYNTIVPEKANALPIHVERLESALSAIGLKQPDDIAKRIMTWRSGRYRAIRSDAARAALEAMLPALMSAFAKSADPRTAVNRFDQLIAQLPSAINFFTLLLAQPSLFNLLANILCHAPTLANDLSRRAVLLDGLVDASALAPVPEVAAFANRLSRQDMELEEQLDFIRQVVGELRFAVGAQIISGNCDPMIGGESYARIAEAAVEAIAKTTIKAFEEAHGTIAESELLILALGRLGGGILTHASDLDLVFVFTGNYQATSQGPKPLGAMVYYNRLVQRIIANLSVPTAAGPLYPIDTRLRPSGAKGELCVSLAGFTRYQREEAWTWEHMALTRARAIYGSEIAKNQLIKTITDVLKQPHNVKRVRADAIEMRALIGEHKPAAGPFDVKLGSGGLVDLEFCVHVQQLQHGVGLSPDLYVALGAFDLLQDLRAAYTLMTKLLIILRLTSPDGGSLPLKTRTLVARLCGVKSWQTLQRQLSHAQRAVLEKWALVTAN